MGDNTGYVYFLVDEEYKFCKIGYSSDPSRRLARAQVDCPLRLVMFHSIPGSKRLEQQLQMEFGPQWVRGE